LAKPYQSEQYLKFLRQLIQQVRCDKGVAHPITIAVDEWNVWYRAAATEGLEERYELSDALAVAIYLNMMRRNCSATGMAALAQMVNVIAPIMTSPEGLFRQTIYYPLRLAAEKSGPIALDAWVGCDSYQARQGRSGGGQAACAEAAEAPYLDCLASFDQSTRKLFISLVNAYKDQTQEVAISIQDADVRPNGVAHVITGEAPDVTNSFGKEVVQTQQHPISNAGWEFTYPLAPMAHTVLELEVL